MAWFVEVLELTYGARDASGQLVGCGVFRLCATSDEGGGGPHPGCEHEHKTPREAEECAEANEKIAQITGISRPNPKQARHWVHVFKDDGGAVCSEIVAGKKPDRHAHTLMIGLVPLV